MKRIYTSTVLIAAGIAALLSGVARAQSTSNNDKSYETFDNKQTEKREIDNYRIESREKTRQERSEGLSLDSLPDLEDSADPEDGWMESMRSNVAVMVTVQNRDKALFSNPSITLGHAVRIRPPESKPRWITSRSWLTNKDRLCLIRPGKQPKLDNSGRLPSAADSSDAFRSDTSNDERLEWYREHKEKCRKVDISASDRKTNLALLSVESESDGSGLKLGPKDPSDIDNRLYLFTLLGQARPAQLRDLPARPSARALQFYWSIKTSANPGTPLSTSDGRLVGISAFQHPHEATHMLFIPAPFIREGLTRLRSANGYSN
jgi:hypothetical protein